MNNLSDILRHLMAEMDLSESELARRTQIGQPVIHRILSGETDNPRVGTLSQIANYFSISISQLIGDAPLPHERLSGTHHAYNHHWAQVPLLTWEQAVLWPKQKETIQNPIMVATDLPISKNAFALKVKDTTMLARFVEGMILIIEPEIIPKNYDFAILYIENQKQVIFKQILQDGNDIYLKSLNPDFRTLLMNTSETRIVGKIIQAKEDL